MMSVKGLTDGSLRDLHNLIRNALQADDAHAASTAKPYGVREHPDWRKQADEFEAEMTMRKIEFVPIAWS